MLLRDRTALIHGGGAIGGAVARAFIAEGAKVFVVPHAEVDALDEQQVERHADALAAKTGGIDIALNAIGVAHVQGVPLLELPLEDYWLPVQTYLRTNFITARAAARHMVKRGRGVILMLSTPAGRMPGPGFMGHSVACAGVEGMARHLAGELGASGVRVVCIRSHAIPQTLEAGSHANEVFDRVAQRAGTTTHAMLAGAAQGTLLKRLPTLDQLAGTAVYAASDRAGAVTGAVLNLTAGMILD
jgi:3-oxoacyl-[acyl-carrier protein] reductase